ncbi:MAG: hypothetical protein JW891_10995 [Candidatus Lokiarchaeota archaeon]|nr:hypothetical protein [Candidatus Lokiarchaeota archaeon]
MNQEISVDETIETKNKRLLSIDFFKGLTIILMTFVNTTRTFEYIPAWSKHAGNFGLTYVDLIAPFFVFMMALNFKSSFMKRLEKDGRKSAYLHFVRRYLIFLFIGLVISINFDDAGNLVFHWGTLQYLGTSGLIALFLIELHPGVRVIIAIMLMGIHQWLLETSLKSVIYDAVEAGFFGALSWGGIMILSTVISEGIYEFKKKQDKSIMINYFLISGIFLTMLGFLLNLISAFNFNWAISRQYMSLPYCLTTTGISAIVFFFIFVAFDLYELKFKFFREENFISVIGKNAFILFIIHCVIFSITNTEVPTNIPLLLAFFVGFVSIFIIWAIGYIMNMFQIFIIV